MTAAARRAAVAEVQAAAAVSERQACRYVGVARSSLRYRPTRDDTGLRQLLEQLAVERPRWGYRRLHVLVRRRGAVVNHKRVYRVYRAAGLAVRRRRRKRVAVARRPLVPATRPNERWSLDFVADRFGTDRRFRALTIVDDFTREALAIEVDTSLPGARVCRVLDRLALTRGLPATLVTDNGPEFAGRALDVWAYRHGIQLAFIQPASRPRTLMSRASTASSATSASPSAGSSPSPRRAWFSNTGAATTTPSGPTAAWTTSPLARSFTAGS